MPEVYVGSTGAVVAPSFVTINAPALSPREQITITGTSGTVWPLNGTAGISLLWGRRGHDAAPVTNYVDEPPSLDGGVWRGVRSGVREVFYPLYFTASSRLALRALRRQFIADIHPRNGPVTIVVRESDGTVRTLSAYYDGGFEGDASQGNSGYDWINYGVSFRAVDPFWLGPPIAQVFSAGSSTSFYPIGPIVTVQPSQVLGTSFAVNPGDVEALPVWTFTAPFTSVSFALGSRAFTVAVSLAAGKTLTVDTRPGRGAAAVIDSDGVSRWANVTSSDMWRLPPGNSTVTLTVLGSTIATTATFSFQPRYEMD